MSSTPCIRVCSATALASATLLGGCGTYLSTLDARDNSAPIVTARALHRMAGPGGGGLEAEVHGVRAKSSQNFTDIDAATLNGQTILGPTTLNHRVSAQHVQLVYNHLLFPGRTIEMEWFAGATVSRLQWDTRSTRPSDPQLSYRRTWYGPVAGLVGRVPLAPGLALEARFSGAIEFRRIFGGSRTGAELALAWSPVPMLQLRGGIAHSQSSVDREVLGQDLSMRARGPFASLAFNF